MNVSEIARQFSVIVIPLIPYLISGAQEAAKVIGKHIGDASLIKIKALWDRIAGASKNDRVFQDTTNMLKSNPDDSESQAILVKCIASHLEKDPTLAIGIFDLLKEKSIQHILAESSTVGDIHQKLNNPGEQQVILRDSQSGSITQEG